MELRENLFNKKSSLVTDLQISDVIIQKFNEKLLNEIKKVEEKLLTEFSHDQYIENYITKKDSSYANLVSIIANSKKNITWLNEEI